MCVCGYEANERMTVVVAMTIFLLCTVLPLLYRPIRACPLISCRSFSLDFHTPTLCDIYTHTYTYTHTHTHTHIYPPPSPPASRFSSGTPVIPDLGDNSVDRMGESNRPMNSLSQSAGNLHLSQTRSSAHSPRRGTGSPVRPETMGSPAPVPFEPLFIPHGTLGAGGGGGMGGEAEIHNPRALRSSDSAPSLRQRPATSGDDASVAWRKGSGGGGGGGDHGNSSVVSSRLMPL